MQPGPRPRPVADRFWEKVEKIPFHTCWEWIAGRSNGYGAMTYFPLGSRIRTELAHRISWVLANGPIPEEMHVLHKCDNPGCVRPDHLFLGTNDDNIQDKTVKGRAAMKLAPQEVEEIRRLYQSGEAGPKRIAERFGLGKSTVRSIILGRTWRHLAAPSAGRI
jgi:hypothetical protein